MATVSWTTARGLGGIAAFVLAGDPPGGLCAQLPMLSELADGELRHTWLRNPQGENIDEILIARLDDSAGRKYYLTGHGGTACAYAILSTLVDYGYEEIPTGNDLADRESNPPGEKNSPNIWQDLFSRCRTPAQAHALAQAFAKQDSTRFNYFREMLRPRVICLAGAPNAGKSSLFNALLNGEHALVTDIPGTTRDTVSRPAVFGEYYGELIDTAGFRDDATDALENESQKRAAQILRRADLIICLIPANAPGGKLSPADLSAIASVKVAGRKTLLVISKSDLANAQSPSLRTEIADALEDFPVRKKIFPPCGITVNDSASLERLREIIADNLA